MFGSTTKVPFTDSFTRMMDMKLYACGRVAGKAVDPDSYGGGSSATTSACDCG
jgi:hypothetical protein